MHMHKWYMFMSMYARVRMYVRVRMTVCANVRRCIYACMRYLYTSGCGAGYGATCIKYVVPSIWARGGVHMGMLL